MPATTVTTTATAMAATTARTVAATAATTRPRKRGRPKRGGRRLLGVVLHRLLATKKASMPTVHGFGGFRIAQIHRLRYFISGWRVKIGQIACIGRCYNNRRGKSLGH